MVKLGEMTLIRIDWNAIGSMQSGVFHHLNDGQRRILTLLVQELTSVDFSYNLFAQTRALPDTMRESFHHAKCYIGAVRRYHRLMQSTAGYGWPGPVAAKLKPLIKIHGPKLECYIDARDAIEHVDEHGKTAVWWMAAMDETGLKVKKDVDGVEIRVELVGGAALTTCVDYHFGVLDAVVDHFGTAVRPRSP